MKNEEKKEIYQERVQDIYKRLNTSEKGLSKEEAAKRLSENGENKLTERKKKSGFVLFCFHIFGGNFLYSK